MRKRFAQIVKKILKDRDLSQQQLADRYLDVSQACVRDYVGGEKTSPTQVRLITMIKIADLYGCTVDSLYHYLRTGRWKRNVNITDVEGYIRSIEDPKILLAVMALVHSLLEAKLETITLPEPKKKFNPSSAIIDLIETESERVGSSYQWEMLLRAFEISEEEIENLYLGQLPSLELLMKLSKVLRMEVEELTNLLESPPESITVTSIPTNADSIAECIDGKHCDGDEEESPSQANASSDMVFQCS